MLALFYLLAAICVGRWLASYPLQCSYTVTGLDPGSPLAPRAARGAVFGLVFAVIISAYWMLQGMPIKLELLAVAIGGAVLAHMLIDYIKIAPSMLGQFKVASQAEFEQIAIDYKSKDAAVVAAAKAKSESSKYFWWSNGLLYVAYGLLDLGLIYLVK